jgi:hypothetical protein
LKHNFGAVMLDAPSMKMRRFLFFSFFSYLAACALVLAFAIFAVLAALPFASPSVHAMSERSTDFSAYAGLLGKGDKMRMIISFDPSGPTAYTLRYEYADE